MTENYLNIGLNLREENLGKAFSYVSLGLSISPKIKEDYYKEYVKIVESWLEKLTEKESYSDALKVLDVAQDLFPQSPDFNYLLATVLYRIDKNVEAWQYSVKALEKCKKDPKALELCCSLANFLVDRWQFPMLNDSKRNLAYRNAIEKCVKNGHKNVLDIGTGSSILSIYAAKNGASKIYSCEEDVFMHELANNVVKFNSCEDKIQIINEFSTDLRISQHIPQKVTLVITETFDAGLFGEGILKTLDHAWDNLLSHSQWDSTSIQSQHVDVSVENGGSDNLFGSQDDEILKSDSGTSEETPGVLHYQEFDSPTFEFARVIPSHAEVWVAIVESNYIARQTKLISNEEIFGERVILELEENYLCEKLEKVSGKYSLLTLWKKVLEVDFNSPKQIKEFLSGNFSEEFELQLENPGRADGLLLAYKLYTDAENCINTFPTSDCCWENAVYPILDLHKSEKNAIFYVNMFFEDGILKFDIKNEKKLAELSKMSTNLTKTKTKNKKASSKLKNSKNEISEISNQNFAKTNDVEFLKCANSSSYCDFFDKISKNLLKNENGKKLKVLDACPFPLVGILLSDAHKVYIENENVLNLLKNVEKYAGKIEDARKIFTSEIEEHLDLIFYWPFTQEGTLKQNIFDDLKFYKKLLKAGGQICPRYLDVNLMGIESDDLLKMTKIDDTNTLGVKIEEIFNLFKTMHHLDIGIEAIDYNPISIVQTCLTLDLNKITWLHKVEKDHDTNSKILLIVEDASYSKLKLEAVNAGRLDGFAYWFEIFNVHALSESNCYDKQLALEIEALKIQKHAKVLLEYIDNTERNAFNSLSKDSPINQCIFFLNEPVNIVEQFFEVEIYASNGSLNISQ